MAQGRMGELITHLPGASVVVLPVVVHIRLPVELHLPAPNLLSFTQLPIVWRVVDDLPLLRKEILAAERHLASGVAWRSGAETAKPLALSQNAPRIAFCPQNRSTERIRYFLFYNILVRIPVSDRSKIRILHAVNPRCSGPRQNS
jgi:hypothetical protein